MCFSPSFSSPFPLLRYPVCITFSSLPKPLLLRVITTGTTHPPTMAFSFLTTFSLLSTRTLFPSRSSVDPRVFTCPLVMDRPLKVVPDPSATAFRYSCEPPSLPFPLFRPLLYLAVPGPHYHRTPPGTGICPTNKAFFFSSSLFSTSPP